MNNLTSARISLLVILLAGILIACKGDKDVLDINTMKQLMWDMSRVDKYVENYLRRDTTLNLEAETSKRYATVLQLYKVDETRFRKSFDYYRSDPLRFRRLMDSVNAYANRVREQNYSDKANESAASDSANAPTSR